MAKSSACSSMAAPRWLVVAAYLLVGYLILALFVRLVHVSRANRRDGFTEQDPATASVDLVYVFMDGCGHCRNFDPTWSRFKGKYDAALASAGVSALKLKNDSDDAKLLGVTGFPTVMLVFKTGADPISYDGPRTVEGLAGFVHKNVPAFLP